MRPLPPVLDFRPHPPRPRCQLHWRRVIPCLLAFGAGLGLAQAIFFVCEVFRD